MPSYLAYIVGGYYTMVAVITGKLLYENYNGLFYNREKAICDIQLQELDIHNKQTSEKINKE